MSWNDELCDLVAEWVPAGAKVLEVGCGKGELARRLQREGHLVTAIDPEAPAGPIFRRVTLEELADAGPFDVVVASRSLHHVRDLAAALDKIAGLLEPGGALILNEFAPDRADDATLRWCATHLPPGHLHLGSWHEYYGDLHGHAEMSAMLRQRFEELLFRWRPYLGRELGRPELDAEERELIAAGRIRALGYQYVGRTPC
jgi:ubiquinone/menaquinone biosynthesis C-methylase UbiE